MAETKRTILERIDARLTLVEAQVAQLLTALAQLTVLGNEIKQGVIMANQALTDLTVQLNDATNAVSARIDRLITGLQDVATPAQLAELGALRDHLTALGQDPVNPIPPAPPATPGI